VSAVFDKREFRLEFMDVVEKRRLHLSGPGAVVLLREIIELVEQILFEPEIRHRLHPLSIPGFAMYSKKIPKRRL